MSAEHTPTPPAPADDASARVDEDGCCVGCGRSVQPSPCCPDYTADDASGAEAMREACAKLCDEVAAEDLADEREADEAGDDQISAMARESVRTATYLAETIRALPLPASDDAVEEAARALIESVPPDFWNNDPPTDDTEVAYAIDYALLDALRAALRREKESRSDDSRPASGQGGDK